jgi:hypothetical protein
VTPFLGGFAPERYRYYFAHVISTLLLLLKLLSSTTILTTPSFLSCTNLRAGVARSGNEPFTGHPLFGLAVVNG